MFLRCPMFLQSMWRKWRALKAGFFRITDKAAILGWTLVIPLIIGALLSIFILPKIIDYYKVRKYKELSYEMILTALKSDSNIEVKKMAVMCLGNIADNKSINFLANEMISQPELSKEISYFIKSNNVTNMNDDNLLAELKKVYSNRSLMENDNRHRILDVTDKSIRSLRDIKKFLEEENLTQSEKRVIDSIGLISNLESNIDKLNEIQVLYSKKEDKSVDFVSIANSLNGQFIQLKSEINDIIKSKDSYFALIGKLEEYSTDVSVLKNQLEKKEKDQQNIILKYRNIISSLVKSGLPKTVTECRNMSEDNNVAHSIRIQAIEALGVIGTHRELELLLKLTKHHDPSVRKSSLASIGMIFTNIRDEKMFDPEIIPSLIERQKNWERYEKWSKGS